MKLTHNVRFFTVGMGISRMAPLTYPANGVLVFHEYTHEKPRRHLLNQLIKISKYVCIKFTSKLLFS